VVTVVKIGGSILKDEKDLELIVHRVRDYAEADRLIVVVSAVKNVTNELIEAVENRDKSIEIVNNVYDKYVRLLSKVSEGKKFENAFKEISKMADEMLKITWSVRVIDEVTPRIRDYILSFGERMSTVLVTASLWSAGLEAIPQIEPLIITDESYGEANVIPSLTEQEIKKISESHQKLIVTPGFIGRTVNGRFTTLGRGGSDYSATLVGRFSGAREVRLITEVPGIMTGDPKRFRGAKTIDSLSLIEAVELAQLGAKRLHPRTFEPLFEADMKVIIEGLYDEGSTKIVTQCDPSPPIKGIAVLENLSEITVESIRMVGKIGAAAAIMGEAQRAKVNLVSISQPASETTIHLFVERSSKDRLVEKLKELQGSLIKSVESKDVMAVSAVGCGLSRPEVFRRVLKIVGGYDVKSLSRGLSDVSVTFITDREEGYRLAEELHEVIVKWTS
jgi:aspartate kinase